MTPAQRAIETAAAVSVPAWIVTVATNMLPVVQVLAGIAAFIASVLAAAVYVRKLRRG